MQASAKLLPVRARPKHLRLTAPPSGRVFTHLSERAVGQIEWRSIKKLLAHPGLRQVWQEYLAGELEEESQEALTLQEVQALFNSTYTLEERLLLERILSSVQL